MKKDISKNTLCVHAGTCRDEAYHGVNSPIFTSTSFDYTALSANLYPRYFNIPNQDSVAKKIATLERMEDGIVFSSGMAAICTTLLTFLKAGDHAVFQKGLYGGTFNFVVNELHLLGIEQTIVPDNSIESFVAALRPNTKLIYIETPSNPLLSIVDCDAIGSLCRDKGLVSIIDNTFATPINQNPVDYGFDLVIHSATKYLGGHFDITAGAVVGSVEIIDQIRKKAVNFGGSLDSMTCYLLERSIKTLSLRVNAQNDNALTIARGLEADNNIQTVYYPGIASHPGHEIARKQMKGYGGMVSFEIVQDPSRFLKRLKLIKPALSLGGVNTIICIPSFTSHRHLTKEEKEREGISDNLIRLSVGIENPDDILNDLRQVCD